MTYTVYGIRAAGDCEVRYIGATSQTPRQRLFNHRGDRCNGALQEWLLANDDAEAFEIASCATLEEARAGERIAITTALRCGQRLFNRDHVPKHLQIIVPSKVAA